MALNGVDDRYPPQKKSFMMLHHMYEHYIDKFEWFLRADDDVFIKPDKLEKFLRRVDSTKAQFIGEFSFDVDCAINKLNFRVQDKLVEGTMKSLVYFHWSLMKTFVWVDREY